MFWYIIESSTTISALPIAPGETKLIGVVGETSEKRPDRSQVVCHCSKRYRLAAPYGRKCSATLTISHICCEAAGFTASNSDTQTETLEKCIGKRQPKNDSTPPSYTVVVYLYLKRLSAAREYEGTELEQKDWLSIQYEFLDSDRKKRL